MKEELVSAFRVQNLYKKLEAQGITTFDQLYELGAKGIFDIPGVGKKGAICIIDTLLSLSRDQAKSNLVHLRMGSTRAEKYKSQLEEICSIINCRRHQKK